MVVPASLWMELLPVQRATGNGQREATGLELSKKNWNRSSCHGIGGLKGAERALLGSWELRSVLEPTFLRQAGRLFVCLCNSFHDLRPDALGAWGVEPREFAGMQRTCRPEAGARHKSPLSGQPLPMTGFVRILFRLSLESPR